MCFQRLMTPMEHGYCGGTRLSSLQGSSQGQRGKSQAVWVTHSWSEIPLVDVRWFSPWASPLRGEAKLYGRLSESVFPQWEFALGRVSSVAIALVNHLVAPPRYLVIDGKISALGANWRMSRRWDSPVPHPSDFFEVDSICSLSLTPHGWYIYFLFSSG